MGEIIQIPKEDWDDIKGQITQAIEEVVKLHKRIAGVESFIGMNTPEAKFLIEKFEKSITHLNIQRKRIENLEKEVGITETYSTEIIPEGVIPDVTEGDTETLP